MAGFSNLSYMSDIRHTCHNFFRQIQDNGLHFPGFASIFRDRPPPFNFFFFQLQADRYIPLCRNPVVQNSKTSY